MASQRLLPETSRPPRGGEARRWDAFTACTAARFTGARVAWRSRLRFPTSPALNYCHAETRQLPTPRRGGAAILRRAHRVRHRGGGRRGRRVRDWRAGGDAGGTARAGGQAAHHAPTLRPPRPPRALRSPRRGRGQPAPPRRRRVDAVDEGQPGARHGGPVPFRGTVQVTFEFDDVQIPHDVWSAENAVFAGADAWRTTFDRRVEQRPLPEPRWGLPALYFAPKEREPLRRAVQERAIAAGFGDHWSRQRRAAARRGSSTGGRRSRRARTSGRPGASSPTSPTSSRSRRRPRSRSRSRRSPSFASASTRTARASTARSAARARASKSRSSRCCRRCSTCDY